MLNSSTSAKYIKTHNAIYDVVQRWRLIKPYFYPFNNAYKQLTIPCNKADLNFYIVLTKTAITNETYNYTDCFCFLFLPKRLCSITWCNKTRKHGQLYFARLKI